MGTNDIKDKSPNEIVDNIVDICQDITIKQITVNNLISKLCRQRSWGLIRHNNITTNHLNSYGLHLNKAGSSVFAKNVINYLNSGLNSGLNGPVPGESSDAPTVNTINHAYVNQSIGYAKDYSDPSGDNGTSVGQHIIINMREDLK